MVAFIPERSTRHQMFSLALVGALVAAVAGCSEGPTKAKPITGSNLKKVAMLYMMYTQNNTTPLAKNDQLIAYAKTLSPEGMKTMDIDVTQVEQYFKSPRDGKPYRLVFKLPPSDPTNPPVVAYEETGVGGKREVGFMNGNVEEIDDARLRQLVPNR
jgi:hypothetical protein